MNSDFGTIEKLVDMRRHGLIKNMNDRGSVNAVTMMLYFLEKAFMFKSDQARILGYRRHDGRPENQRGDVVVDTTIRKNVEFVYPGLWVHDSIKSCVLQNKTHTLPSGRSSRTFNNDQALKTCIQKAQVSPSVDPEKRSHVVAPGVNFSWGMLGLEWHGGRFVSTDPKGHRKTLIPHGQFHKLKDKGGYAPHPSSILDVLPNVSSFEELERSIDRVVQILIVEVPKDKRVDESFAYHATCVIYHIKDQKLELYDPLYDGIADDLSSALVSLYRDVYGLPMSRETVQPVDSSFRFQRRHIKSIRGRLDDVMLSDDSSGIGNLESLESLRGLKLSDGELATRLVGENSGDKLRALRDEGAYTGHVNSNLNSKTGERDEVGGRGHDNEEHAPTKAPMKESVLAYLKKISRLDFEMHFAQTSCTVWVAFFLLFTHGGEQSHARNQLLQLVDSGRWGDWNNIIYKFETFVYRESLRMFEADVRSCQQAESSQPRQTSQQAHQTENVNKKVSKDFCDNIRLSDLLLGQRTDEADIEAKSLLEKYSENVEKLKRVQGDKDKKSDTNRRVQERHWFRVDHVVGALLALGGLK